MPAKISPTPGLDPSNIDSKFVAALFGLTRTRVSQLHSEGVIRNKGTRGRYDLHNVVVAYLDYLENLNGEPSKND